MFNIPMTWLHPTSISSAAPCEPLCGHVPDSTRISIYWLQAEASEIYMSIPDNYGTWWLSYRNEESYFTKNPSWVGSHGLIWQLWERWPSPCLILTPNSLLIWYSHPSSFSSASILYLKITGDWMGMINFTLWREYYLVTQWTIFLGAPSTFVKIRSQRSWEGICSF